MKIQKRSELYDSLLRLRQGLDKLQDVFDPKKLDKMTDLSNIDLGVVESIKQQLKDIYSNRYLDPQIVGLIKRLTIRSIWIPGSLKLIQIQVILLIVIRCINYVAV